jgi:DNA polymerase-3 subunit alpha
MSTFFSVHTHTRYSRKDGASSVQRNVDKAVELGYPALSITDHGTLSGAVQHYLACRKAGIEPLIGMEAYVAFDRHAGKRATTMHATIVAFNEVGYRNLVLLNNQAWRQFHYQPVIDLGDLAQMSAEGRLDGLLMTGGCWFGLVPRWIRENDAASVLNIISALSGWFDGRFFIEIHNHNVDHEDQSDVEHARLLHDMAVAMHIPTVLAQDSHYVERNEQPIHDAFKTLTSWDTTNPDAAVFPGDGYHMVDTAWMRSHHPKDIFDRGMAGLDLILSWAEMRLPELEAYTLRTPDVTLTGNAINELVSLAKTGLNNRLDSGEIPPRQQQRYVDRLEEELAVVEVTGFAGYLLLVERVCSWMRRMDILYSVRGSGVGSLLCWLTGITGYDPISWGLSFDRFLSADRIKPPDIDIDVEHERRGEVLAWLDEKFYTVHIGTDTQYGVGENDEGEQNGSLARAWQQRARNIGADPNAPVPDVWRAKLKAIAAFNGRRQDGTVIEPPISSFGVHPAGMLIAPDQATLDTIPIQYVASSKTFVTAYDQHDIEKLGLVKLDVLGLRTLTTLRVCQEMTGIKFDEIRLNDRKVFTDAAKDTTGLFQIEGSTSARGVKRMRPSKIADLIAAMALFRPAARDSGATEAYLRRRSGVEPITKRHQLITNHTDGTYGVLVYQEQAINILKDLGLTVEEIEVARNAIKASNANVAGAAKALDGLMARIDTLAQAHGLSKADVAWLSDALHAYAGYSFNLAHATAYGVMAYATAWYRTKYPVAFWTGVLRANADAPAKYKDAAKPEVIYLNAARRAGVDVRPPHVNHSGLTYRSDGKVIYKGIGSVLGIGPVAAKELVEKAPFTSLDDLALRCASRKVSGTNDLGKGIEPVNCPGHVKLLYLAGALEDLTREKADSDVTV